MFKLLFISLRYLVSLFSKRVIRPILFLFYFKNSLRVYKKTAESCADFTSIEKVAKSHPTSYRKKEKEL
jgi:hypothetical protein